MRVRSVIRSGATITIDQPGKGARMAKHKPLKIPVLTCCKCRYRRKPRLVYKEPYELIIHLPSLLLIGHKSEPIYQKEDGGFWCYCPVCGAKHDLILEREVPKGKEVSI